MRYCFETRPRPAPFSPNLTFETESDQAEAKGGQPQPTPHLPQHQSLTKKDDHDEKTNRLCTVNNTPNRPEKHPTNAVMQLVICNLDQRQKEKKQEVKKKKAGGGQTRNSTAHHPHG